MNLSSIVVLALIIFLIYLVTIIESGMGKGVLIIVIIGVIYYYFTYLSGSSSYNVLSGIVAADKTSTTSYDSLPTTITGTVSANYTWSTWLYVDDWNYNYGNFKPILGVDTNVDTFAALNTLLTGGYSSTATSPLAIVDTAPPKVSACPYLVFDRYDNNIIVCISTTKEGTPSNSTIYNTNCITVQDIPVQKWINVIVSVNTNVVDIYLDGKLVSTTILEGKLVTPAKTSKVVIAAANGKNGFSGFVSNFQFFASATDPQTAWDLYSTGFSSTGLQNPYSVELSLSKDGAVQSYIKM